MDSFSFLISFAAPCIALLLVLRRGLPLQLRDFYPLPLIAGLIYLILPRHETWESFGHEGGYVSIFEGAELQTGSTLLYPSMQLLWKTLGLLSLGYTPIIPVFALVCSALCVVLLQKMIYEETDNHFLSLAAFLLILNTEFLGWSIRAYNIIYPLLCILLAQFILVRRSKELLSASGAVVLAILLRLEYIIFLPFFLYQLRHYSLREQLVSLGVSGALLSVGLYPLMDNLPGSGDWWLSLGINLLLFEYLSPPIWLIVIAFATSKKHRLMGIFLGVVHAALATFNDFGARHLLPIAPLILWFCAQHKQAIWLLLSVSVFWGYQYIGFRTIYHAEHETYLQDIEKRFPQLPRLSLEQARSEGCAWIAEEYPFAAQPERSHFNLYQPEEVRSLKQEHACIHWCSGLEDWRWSPLSVRDRAIRLHHLHRTQAVAVVQSIQNTCLLYTVEAKE